MEISQDAAQAKPMPRMIALAMAFFTTAVITTSVAMLFAGNVQVASTVLAGA
jgi:hypothetical protein